jgi:hypothetical protein
MLTNNEILKKLRVALQLKDTDIIDILKMANFEISRGALGDLFRAEDHPSYIEAGDQLLRNFLNGLVIYKRGLKTESPERNTTTIVYKPQPNIVPKIEQKKEKKPYVPFGQKPTDKPTKPATRLGNSVFKKDHFSKKK